MKYSIFLVLSLISIQVNAETKTALFAGGCFWCMEKPFDKVDGVVRTTSGYTGGSEENATYKKTSTGKTKHYEAIEIEYDPAIVSYEKLLDVFWKNIDPFDDKGQFCDKGPQYRAAIFPNNEQEAEFAEKSKQELQARIQGKQEIVTEIILAKPFYHAEDYHQDYYQKNPLRYKYYRYSCGRDKRLEAVSKIINPSE